MSGSGLSLEHARPGGHGHHISPRRSGGGSRSLRAPGPGSALLRNRCGSLDPGVCRDSSGGFLPRDPRALPVFPGRGGGSAPNVVRPRKPSSSVRDPRDRSESARVCGRTRPLRVVTSEARVRVLVLNSEGQLEAAGDVVQPSEVLHKHPVLVERGSFRATKLTLDRLEHAREQFILEPEARGWLPVVLAEMTLRNLLAAGSGNHSDFLT